MNGSSRKFILCYALLVLFALGFRLFIALRLPNDTPDDGRVYAQIARNMLEQHVYSHETEAPYVPSILRLPGYPGFLAGLYVIFGHGNNSAVRVAQAFIDTATCLALSLLAFFWVEDQTKRRAAAIAALALAAVCPAPAIYVGTILTEVWTDFLVIGMCLLATLAFKSSDNRRALILWFATGLIAGLAVLFRPDSGLFAAAIGLTIVISSLFTDRVQTRLFQQVLKAIPAAGFFTIAFCLVLVPWTIRNRRVFGVFQPLAPAHGEMPGEFVPHGYLRWVRSWLYDGRYIGPVIWRLDSGPININAYPAYAFDSPEERERVATLIAKYDSPGNQPTPTPSPVPTPSPSPSSSAETASENQEEDEEEEDTEQDEADAQGDAEITPEIDAAFGQLARERIARAPFRYYVKLPFKRALSLWFDTHSQYYPFEGELLPLKDLDYDLHQHIWLPLFAGITWFYTLLGAIGAWFLWRLKTVDGKRWLLMAALMIFLRLGFFSTLENPEPRYVVEIFPFLSVLGGIGMAYLLAIWKTNTDETANP